MIRTRADHLLLQAKSGGTNCNLPSVALLKGTFRLYDWCSNARRSCLTTGCLTRRYRIDSGA